MVISFYQESRVGYSDAMKTLELEILKYTSHEPPQIMEAKLFNASP